ncbi:MAG: hypothetical protein LWX56_01990 [Ignavibacteria bacterium]|nr:hypothetical protein [Ignavibacteria bacterium]
MSFYPQPDTYSCGPFALKYALIMLGETRDEHFIARKAGSTWWHGTDEIGLAKAARACNCKMNYFHSSNALVVVKRLHSFLNRGIPCVLSVDNWEHWLTVVSESAGKYVLIDSKQDRVILVCTQKTLLNRWLYTDSETHKISYDGYAIIPDHRVKVKARLTIEMAHYIMRKSNADLANKWNEYLNDLIAICKPATPHAKKTITFAEFIRRNEHVLTRQAAYWHGSPSYKELQKLLGNLSYVATTYNLLVYCTDEKRVLTDLACLLTLYACGKYGIRPVY